MHSSGGVESRVKNVRPVDFFEVDFEFEETNFLRFDVDKTLFWLFLDGFRADPTTLKLTFK